MDILIKVAQLILSLSILVVFHEAGHFFFARLFKTRVEKFYLFFNPWFSLFKMRKTEKGWSFKFFSSEKNTIDGPADHTEYGIGWLPLGGYVKIAGMIDESMDKEAMKLPAQEWEFRSKKPWQRLLIMVGGVTVNVILAVVIYIGMLFSYGETILPLSSLKYGIAADSLGQSYGFRNGDKIVTVNNKEVAEFTDIYQEFILNEPHSFQIDRNGEKIEITFTEEMIAQVIKSSERAKLMLTPRIPFIIDGFAEKSAAKDAGAQLGDEMIGVNGLPVQFHDEFRAQIVQYKKQTIPVTVLRKGQKIDLTVTVPENGIIGIAANINPATFFEMKTVEYSLFSAIPAGIVRGYNEIKSYLKQLRLVFSPKTEAYKSVGSFISIGKMFPSVWVWEIFWSWTAFLSIVLAIINILPIPALDGGHVMFLMYEIIARRKPSDKFLEYAQLTGMVILLTLFVFAIGNDIFRHIIN